MDGAHTVYAYDASGQRVLQATVAFGTHAGTATAYTPAGQVEDADTSATTVGDVTGTRYYCCAPGLMEALIARKDGSYVGIEEVFA